MKLFLLSLVVPMAVSETLTKVTRRSMQLGFLKIVFFSFLACGFLKADDLNSSKEENLETASSMIANNAALTGTFFERLQKLFNSNDPSIGISSMPNLDTDFDPTIGKSLLGNCVEFYSPDTLKPYQHVTIQTGDALTGIKKYSGYSVVTLNGQPITARRAQEELKQEVANGNRTELTQDSVQSSITNTVTFSSGPNTCKTRSFYKVVTLPNGTKYLLELIWSSGQCAIMLPSTGPRMACYGLY